MTVHIGQFDQRQLSVNMEGHRSVHRILMDGVDSPVALHQDFLELSHRPQAPGL